MFPASDHSKTQLRQQEEDSIPPQQSFLHKLRKQEAPARKVSVTLPEGIQGPSFWKATVSVDGRTFDICMGNDKSPGDTIEIMVPQATPLCTKERENIMQHLKRPLRSKSAHEDDDSVASPDAIRWRLAMASPDADSNREAYSDENIRERLHQYKSLQGRSMQPGVKSIPEKEESQASRQSIESTAVSTQAASSKFGRAGRFWQCFQLRQEDSDVPVWF